MVRIVRRLLPGLALLLTAACEGPPAEPGGGDEAARDAAHREPEHAGGETAAAHDGLPLRAIMQRLAGEMASFSYALWLEDYGEMTARAAAIAEHPHMSPEEIRRIEAELGTAMPAFEEADEAVHLAAVRLHEAAGARRLEDVLSELDEVQRGCVSCHTRFRERLRTDTAATAGR